MGESLQLWNLPECPSQVDFSNVIIQQPERVHLSRRHLGDDWRRKFFQQQRPARLLFSFSSCLQPETIGSQSAFTVPKRLEVLFLSLSSFSRSQHTQGGKRKNYRVSNRSFMCVYVCLAVRFSPTNRTQLAHTHTHTHSARTNALLYTPLKLRKIRIR
jgi:hypothetical protein